MHSARAWYSPCRQAERLGMSFTHDHLGQVPGASADMSPSLSSALVGTNGAADALKSKQAGHLVQCERPKTLADGLRGRLGDLTWPIVRDFVDDIITVSEQEIIDAMQLCFERLKVR